MPIADAAYPRISVVIPCFKAAGTIKRTFDSIIAQNYPDLQLIVMDGGSTDGTVEVIKTFEKYIDYWVSEKDKGQVDALNKGFLRADGELFGWICADDEFLPGALRRLAEEFLAHPETDVVTGGCRRNFNDDYTVDTSPDPAFLNDLDFKNTIEQPSTLWRQHTHHSAGPLDGTYKFAFDWEYWCRMKRTGAVFRAIPEPLSLYHFSSENLTSTGGRKIADEMYRIVKEYGPYNGRIADVYRMLYRVFDLRGYYDKETAETMPKWKRAGFFFVLQLLYRRYDAHVINSYNWNFVSRQERGLQW
jgi:glycosyltransferase involved in cell wall biosynthesis